MTKRPLTSTLILAATLFASVVDAFAPGPPQSLVANVSGNLVTLTWQAPNTGDVPSTYVVEAAFSPSGAVIASLPVTATQLVVSAPNGIYYVRVRGVDNSGFGEASNEVIVVVPGGGGRCSSPPRAPQDLTGSASGNTVTLNWSAPSSGCAATSYAVHAGSSPGLSNVTVANVGAATSLSASAPAGTYYVRVVALNTFGGSAASNEVAITVGSTPTGAPVAPAGLMVGTLVMKDRSAAISWVASPGAAEYVVEVGSTAGGIDGGVYSAGAATSFTLRDLRAGRSHVRIKARNGLGTSGASPEATFVLPDLGDYVEALFLGSGPLIYSPNLSCPRPGMWSGFPRGTTVRNRASAQIPAFGLDAIRRVLDQVPLATAGRLATTFEVVPEDAPTVAENQMVHVALRTAAELQFACGSTGGFACIAYNSPVERGGPFSGGVIRWSAGYYVVPNIPFNQPYSHEPGHGILGMCHINADGIGGGQHSMMSAGPPGSNQLDRLSPFDIEALQAVYGSSVAIGARRPEFVAAGLLKP